MEISHSPKHQSFRTIFFLTRSALAILLAFSFDGVVERFILAHANRALFQLAQIISHISDWPVVFAVLFFVGALCWKSNRTKEARIVLVLALSAALAGASATAIRTVTGRTRPDASEQQGFYGVWHNGQLLIGRRNFNSFPSGHTATVAGIAGVLLFIHKRMAIATFCYVGILGWARIALRCHHFSDVVASVIIGIAAGVITWNHIAPRCYWGLRAKNLDQFPNQ